MLDLGVFAGLKRVSDPSAEPITVALARTWLRLSHTAEDTTIGALVTAARHQVEADTGLHFGTQLWDLALNVLPADRRDLRLPVYPLQAIVSMKTYTTAGVETDDTTLTNYDVDTYSKPVRLCLKSEKNWPTSLRTHLAAILRLRTGFAGDAIAVSSITRTGSTATITTSTAHGWVTGNVVRMAGADQAEYNGSFDVTVLNDTQFTVAISGTPATPATGAAITATPSGVPAWAALAIRMRLAQFSENRDGLNDAEARLYEWLIEPHRMVWLV